MRGKACAALLGVTLLLVALHGPAGLVAADENNHEYKDGDDVVVWVNTVGPYENRQETYGFFQLGYCQGHGDHDHYHESLGEALQGLELVDYGLDVRFKENKLNATICPTNTLNPRRIKMFAYAIRANYFFQMYVDDLPIGGFVGEQDNESGEAKVYTHFHFNITYNGPRIITADVELSHPLLLDLREESEMNIPFTYSVTWEQTELAFDNRFDRYLDSKFFEHKLRYVSIINSIVMVLFLTGLVVVILMRTLRRDLARYDREADFRDYMDRDMSDEYGWKQVHGDVFRPPPHLSWLSAFIGSGYQLAVVTVLVVLVTIAMDLYEERSSILTLTIVLYALTSTIAGYFSGSFYAQYGGKRWMRSLFLTASLWPGAIAVVSLAVNTVAIFYLSTKAIPFGTMVAVMAIWTFVILPLNVLGAVIGRNWNATAHFPTRVNPIPRPVPEKPWYLERFWLIVLAGLLPFGSVFIEMYFLFTSLWAYKVYYVFGFLLLVMVISWVVTACVTIVAAYFFLNAEDHRWHWVCFLSGGSIAFYVYAYATYYFFARTKMYGLFQTAFYFGYTAVVCFGLFMACGAVGFLSASTFVRRIYSTVKID